MGRGHKLRLLGRPSYPRRRRTLARARRRRRPSKRPGGSLGGGEGLRIGAAAAGGRGRLTLRGRHEACLCWWLVVRKKQAKLAPGADSRPELGVSSSARITRTYF